MRVTLATQPGSMGRPNEDFVAATSTAAVVLDGLSAPEELGTGCRHDTPWYVSQLGTGLLGNITAADPAIPLREVLRSTLAEVTGRHETTCDLAHPGTPSSSVVAIRLAPVRLDYLVLFDSTLLLDGPGGVTRVCDDRVLRFAHTEREATRHHRIGSPEHRAAVCRLVAAEREHRNAPAGYWVAGALPDVVDEAFTGSVEEGAVTSAALLTDGVTCLADDYGVTDHPGLLGMLRERGPVEVIAAVRAAEATDPDGIRWPRYKRGDDATAAVCVL